MSVLIKDCSSIKIYLVCILILGPSARGFFFTIIFYMKSANVEEFHRELEFNKKSDAIMAHQRRLLSRVKPIESASSSDIPYQYALAQAQYICDIYSDIKLLPFKGLYSHFLAMVTKEKFQADHHVIFNDYGMLEINHESLNKLRPIKIMLDSSNSY